MMISDFENLVGFADSDFCGWFHCMLCSDDAKIDRFRQTSFIRFMPKALMGESGVRFPLLRWIFRYRNRYPCLQVSDQQSSMTQKTLKMVTSCRASESDKLHA